MAHEVSFKGGAAELVYAGETPWHRLGRKFTSLGWDDCIAVVDYPVEKLPYYVPAAGGVVVADDGVTVTALAPNPAGYVASTQAYYTYRPDTRAVLGTVTNRYVPVPNKVAFAPLKPLVDEGLLTLEVGGVLRGGRDAWLLGRWDFDRMGKFTQEEFGGEVLPYSTVCANHDGRRGILLGNTAVRIVCANTLGQAEAEGSRSRWVTIAHTGEAEVKLVEAAEAMFKGVVARFEVIARQYRVLKDCHLTNAWFDQLVLDVVAPMPQYDPRFNPDAKTAELVVGRAERKRAEVRRLWTEGAGHTGQLSAWYAYNAAVQALDHNKELWPTRSGAWRLSSLLDGELSKLKNKVLDGLVAHASAA